MKPMKIPAHSTLMRPLLKDKRFQQKIEAGVQRLKVISQIVELREKLDLTQAELAKKMKVSQQLVSRIESGSDNITLETLVRFLTILGVVMNIEIASRPQKQRDVLRFVR